MVGQNLFGSEETYVYKKFDEQHIVLRTDGNRKIHNGTHYFQYFPNKKQVILQSKYEHSAWMLYLYALLPLIPIFFNPLDNLKYFISIFVIMFIFISGFIYLGIRDEAAGMERDLINRINYLRRHGNNKNRP